MTFVCLWIPSWSTDAASSAETGGSAGDAVGGAPPTDRLTDALLRIAPRVLVGECAGRRRDGHVFEGHARDSGIPELIWADARGLPERSLALALCASVRSQGASEVRAGVARTAIAAEIAATTTDARVGGETNDPSGDAVGGAADDAVTVTIVPPGQDRAFLAPHSLQVLCGVLDPDPALLPLLAGVGVETCGDLAQLGREEIEVRFGAEGVRLWRLARAEDHRRPFGGLPRAQPRASCAWTDYTLRDTERLVFVIHRLVGHISDQLRARGEGARDLTLRFALANRSTVEHPLQVAHPTADRTAWMRLIRTALERLRLPDAVTGISVRVGMAVPLHEQQGDIFDRGFATARATEQAVAQLLDTCGTDVVTLNASGHPLLERRAQWRIQESVSLGGLSEMTTVHPSLTLQLLPEPRRIAVVTTSRRDHDVPVRFHEPTQLARTKARDSSCAGSLASTTAVDVVVAAGPDRVDGGLWEDAPYAREYFHCITSDGRLVLLFRTADAWYFHGWWD